MTDDDRLVQVYSTGRIQADLVRSLLEGSGIPATISGEGYSSVYPVTVGAIGEGRVMVRERDRERALEVIAAAVEGELDQEEPSDVPARSTILWIAVALVAIVLIAVVIAGSLPD
jgi:hypothetical protein